ncbi:MAG: PIN domain-containing protein [Kiritimatiellae bacterium]|nr:PIN domain-containing protein [Kiritimatiellia bacterium]
MRVVFDTGVWGAAVRSRRGASHALLSEVPHGRFRFGVSVALFLEYRQQLLDAARRGQTPLNWTQIEAILAALAHHAQEVPIFFGLRPNLPDENDNRVFECAANFGASAIVTHNVRHFLSPELKGYGIEIVTPGEFLERLRRSS